MDKKQVFVVDPDQLWAWQLYKAFYDSGDFVVEHPFEDGETALFAIHRQRPDIVIMEMLLPHYDGSYLINYVYAHMEKYAPFFYIVSALPEDYLMEQYRLCKPTAKVYMSMKPQRPEGILSNVRQIEAALGTVSDSPQSTPPPSDMSPTIGRVLDLFLYGLDNRVYLRGCAAAKWALHYLLVYRPKEIHMPSVCRYAAKQMDTSALAAERLLRSYASAAKHNALQKYPEFFEGTQKLCRSFYWSAYQCLAAILKGGSLKV